MKTALRGWNKIFFAYGLISGAMFFGAIIGLFAINYFGIPLKQPQPNLFSYLGSIVGFIVLIWGILVFVRSALDDEYKRK